MKPIILLIIFLLFPSISGAADLGQTNAPNLLLMLSFAFLGGLILNLMPCVFPILSIKILALKSTSNRRIQGLFYMLGVLFSFFVLAMLVIALKNMGYLVGWGFQMQSPIFVVVLIVLFTLIALNLFGLFELSISIKKSGKGRSGKHLLSAFGSGILASIVTTPCSAPFMATAVGVAFSIGNVSAILIFLMLGFGFSLPYLLLCLLPNAGEILPKPGHWMIKLRQFLAFPILLTIVWLLWVLGHQISLDSLMLLLVSLCFLTLAIWVWNTISQQTLRLPLFFASLLLFALPLYAIEYTQHPVSRGLANETYSAQNLERLLSQQRRVFVYVTASWCITCKMNEKVALDTQAVQDFFKQQHIVLMKADWTNRNDDIFKYLQLFNREGIPLYVYYPQQGEARILPQLLTPSIVMDAINQADQAGQ